jgi:hypothetical protein
MIACVLFCSLPLVHVSEYIAAPEDASALKADFDFKAGVEQFQKDSAAVVVTDAAKKDNKNNSFKQVQDPGAPPRWGDADDDEDVKEDDDVDAEEYDVYDEDVNEDIHNDIHNDNIDGSGHEGFGGDFFDAISCDAIDRQEGNHIDHRMRGAQERSLNMDTFGAVSLQKNDRHGSSRGGRGRGGGRGGRGGGRGGRHGGGGRYNSGDGRGGNADGRGGGGGGGRGSPSSSATSGRQGTNRRWRREGTREGSDTAATDGHGAYAPTHAHAPHASTYTNTHTRNPNYRGSSGSGSARGGGGPRNSRYSGSTGNPATSTSAPSTSGAAGGAWQTAGHGRHAAVSAGGGGGV